VFFHSPTSCDAQWFSWLNELTIRDLTLYDKRIETLRSLICSPIAKDKSQKPKPRPKQNPKPARLSIQPLLTPTKTVLMKTAFQVTAPATTTSTVSFVNLNVASVYDPMGSEGTRQPYGTTTLFDMYRYATVISAKLKITAQGPYGDTSPIVMLMTLQNTSSASSRIGTIEDFYETALHVPDTKVKMFGNYLTKNLDTNNYIVGNYSAARYFGNMAQVMSNPAYACTSSSNPDNSPHIGFYFATPLGSTLTSTAMAFLCELEQVVKWWQPIGFDNN